MKTFEKYLMSENKGLTASQVLDIAREEGQKGKLIKKHGKDMETREYMVFSKNAGKKVPWKVKAHKSEHVS